MAAPLHAQWTEVWGDDFGGAANTTYNHNNWWNNVQSSNPWGDGTVQDTSDSLQNVYLDGNNDLIIALTYNPSNAAFPYTSARLTSTYAAGPYGRIDTRIQNPSVQGAGAAFWALGADAYPSATDPSSADPSTSGGVPWPYCGELDMMEIQAKTAGHNGSTIHGSDYGTDIYVSATDDLASPATFDNAFHEFTTYWGPYHFQFYVDGNLETNGDINLADTAFNDTWELNQPINFILSSGIGGNGGTPGTTGFPSNMTVNYVHYSQLSAGAPSPVTNLSATGSYSNAVQLNWTASATSGVTYDIYASTTQGAAPSNATLVAQNVTGTSYTQTGLQPGTTYYYTVMAADFGGESSASTATAETLAPGSSTGMQLSAGGYASGTYMNSSFVVGGNSNAHLHVPINTAGVTNPAPQQVYDTERWGAAAWTINGLNPGGQYTVRLHFVENTHTGAGQRNFNVSINSQQVLTNFDIVQAAGSPNTALTEQFSTAADSMGIIELQTTYGTSSVADLNPTISGIEIIPGATGTLVGAAPGNITDLAINSGGAAVGGFVADEDFNGGDVGTVSTAPISTTGVTDPAPQAVYQSSRIAPFTYVLSGLEANATYNLRLHFAETYFTQPGQRLFNVAVNAQPFLTNFDVFEAAGAENQAVVETTTASSDQYGQLIIQLLQGAQNTPEISGVEAILGSSGTGSPTPAAPTGLQASVSGSSIALIWTGSTTSGVTYTVYRETGSGAAASIASGVSGTTYSDTTVTSGTSYTYYLVAVAGGTQSSPSNSVTITTASDSGTDLFAIDAGSATAVSGYAADEDFSGGGTYSNDTTVNVAGAANAAPAAVYQSARQGTFTYTLPGLTPGVSYGVRLHFAELYFSSPGQRVFNVAINGISVLANFDIVAAAGAAEKALVTSFTATANSQGQIVISFTNGTVNQPMFNALEVYTLSTAETAINAGGGASGSFAADEDFSGGSTYASTSQPVSTTGVANAAPAAVYQDARQGATIYTLPGFAAGSTHTVRLHFAELYFSSTGQRLFNVAINGTSVLANFDIVQAAGGNFKAVVQTATTTANSQGQVVIRLSKGSTDQPSINAIEVQ